LLVPRELETAQNRKVWAARAKPVLPANDILNFIDNLRPAKTAGFFSRLFLSPPLCSFRFSAFHFLL